MKGNTMNHVDHEFARKTQVFSLLMRSENKNKESC